MVLSASRSLSLILLVMVGVALISPNAMARALHPIPAIGGSVSVVVVFVQMLAAVSSSGFVAASSMADPPFQLAAAMVGFCLASEAPVNSTNAVCSFHLCTPQ
jgi:hypothetical protein